jgi:hypothetical protein
MKATCHHQRHIDSQDVWQAALHPDLHVFAFTFVHYVISTVIESAIGMLEVGTIYQ